jgi:3-oxoadipate enol-lactonase
MTAEKNHDVSTTAVRVRDGADINYRFLTGQGPARFVLIHSLAMDKQFWMPVATLLLKSGSVLLLDCRGHGESSKTGAPFSAEQFAADIASVCDEIGWSKVIVAGASMGGCVALAFAAAYPGRTQALGLVDTTAWYGPKAPGQWEERAEKALANGMAVLAGFQTSRWFSTAFADANPAVVTEALNVFLANDPRSYAEACRLLGRFNKSAALPAIAVPTKILVGSNDYATPVAMAEAMRDAIPGASLQVLEGAAHLTPLERPHDVAKALLELAEAVA